MGFLAKIIYVAGKFRGKTAYEIHCNVVKAEAVALELWRDGWVVFCPHLNTQNFQGELPDEVWLNGCIEILMRCDAIYMMEGYEQSVGALAELEIAEELDLEVIYES